MNRNELLNELDRQNVKLSVKDDRLIIKAAKGVLTPELQHSLKDHKQDLIRLLRQTETITPSVTAIKPDHSQKYEPFPLTDIQQAYWIGRSGIFELGDVAISGYVEFETDNNLDLSRLSMAWQKLIKRHDMLRAVVLPTGEQKILEQVPPYEISILDLRGLENSAKESQLTALRETLSHQILPCDRWPLFDIRASRLDEQRVRIHLKIDLLMMDAASIQILFQEWNQLYQNPAISLTPLGISFRDYVVNQKILQDPESTKRSRGYWFKRLDSLPPAPELPLACFPRELKNYQFKRHRAELECNIWEQLKQRGQKAGLTPSVILLAAFAEVLTVWSKNPRFTINLTVFERLNLHPDVERIIGDFTNTTLLAINNSTLGTFSDRAQQLQQQLLQDMDHLHVTGVEVLRELIRRRQTGLTAIMPIVFTSLLGLNSVNKRDLERNFLGEEVYSISQTPQIWLDHQVTEQNGALIFNWDVVEELFPPGLIDDMFGAYCNLLKDLATSESPWVETKRQLLPPAQLSQRDRINNTSAPISQQTLHGLVIERVKTQPQSVAVIAPDCSLTYEELYQRANQLGHQLQQLGATPNTLIAIVMSKGWEQVVGVLGILISGAAYLPVDPTLPQERQQYLLEQGQVKLVVTQSHLDQLSLPSGVQRVCVEEQLKTSPQIPDNCVDNRDLAYVIYTSGSTGLPKGVAIDHRGAVNTILDINHRFKVTSSDRILALSALNFDLSVYDIFGILAVGGTIVIPAIDGLKDPACWLDLIVEQEITLWNTVPALMQMLVEYLSVQPQRESLCLRLALLSGDWLPVSLPEQIQNHFSDLQVVSLGGATEASIWSICYPIEQVNPNWKSIPYGKPLTNQRFYVLNELTQPCPIWVPGQLYIGGVGLALGYWQDEAKTNTSFITHPVTGERSYKTGDLGRYLPDGNIEFLGRADFQVKINGYRIELGEIEAVLQQMPQVKQVVVSIVGEDKANQRLVAYVASEEPSLSTTQLQSYLRQKLPDYMAIDHFAILKALPLTPNGKIDRKALPAVEFNPVQAEEIIPPRDAIELQLVQIWCDLLNLTSVGVKQNFFNLGGNSLLAVRLTTEIQKQFQKTLTLATLLAHPTISGIAHLLRSSNTSIPWSALVPIQPHGDRPPLFCIHPFGGNVLCYQDLSRHLGNKQPLYGLQAVALNPELEPHTNIESMAAHYIQAIKTVQPQGPYYLCGWSMGGLIAFEMAQQLNQQGEAIAKLAILDSCTRVIIDPAIESGDLTLLVLGLIIEINTSLERLRPMTPDEQLIYVMEEAKRNNTIPADFDLEQIRHLVEMGKLNYQAEQDYQPQSYSGSLMLFQAKETDIDLKATWSELAANVAAEEVPGHHGNMLRPPQVEVLAQKLHQYLNADNLVGTT
ncbi:MAG: amino acid adenylation domain-containing protein [Cyanobacteria bacterium P01_G01_bin.39]